MTLPMRGLLRRSPNPPQPPHSPYFHQSQEAMETNDFRNVAMIANSYN